MSLQSFLLQRTGQDFARTTLSHFLSNSSFKAEARNVLNKTVPQGLEPAESGLSLSRLPTLLGFAAL
jgi:hypothetical protein